MLAAVLDHVDEAFLLTQCEERRSESATLDFKQALPGKADGDKVELLKDVSAMANGDGGDIVYGVAEDTDGAAECLHPITSEGRDSAVRRLTNVLDALEPRLRVQTRVVDVDGGYVLLLRVPASFDGPHSARLPGQGARRFVFRDGTRTADMSYDQVRSAFDRTATLRERAVNFLESRHDLIRGGRTPISLEENPVCVLEVVPLAGLAGRQRFDVAKFFTRGADWARFFVHGGGSHRLNLEGGVAFNHSGSEKSTFYTQVFRNGSIESAFVGGRRGPVRRMGDAEFAYLYTALVVQHFRHSLGEALRRLVQEGFTGPAVVSVALINVEGFALATGDAFRDLTEPADRRDLVVPEAWVEQLEVADEDQVIAPLLDTLWQAFGEARCNYFAPETNVYTPPR